MYIYITEKSKIKKKNAEKLIFDISFKGNVSHINCFVLSHNCFSYYTVNQKTAAFY